MTKCFSLERKTLNSFLDACEKAGDSPNRVIEAFMVDIVRELSQDCKTIKCDVCGAVYSEKIDKCPQCNIKELEQEAKQNEEFKQKDMGEQYEQLKKEGVY